MKKFEDQIAFWARAGAAANGTIVLTLISAAAGFSADCGSFSGILLGLIKFPAIGFLAGLAGEALFGLSLRIEAYHGGSRTVGEAVAGVGGASAIAVCWFNAVLHAWNADSLAELFEAACP